MSSQLEVHNGGPYLQAAFLCNKVITDSAGVNTYVEVIDAFQMAILGPVRPPEGVTIPHVVGFTIVVILRAGEANGPMQLALRLQSPSGEQGPPQEVTVHLSPGRKVNVHIPTQLQFAEGGRYTLQVLVEDKLIGEVPFDVQQGFQTMGPLGL